MNTPQVNVPLLRKAVEWVEEQDKLGRDGNWYQLEYVTERPGCGTCYCVAGYIGQMFDDRYKTDASYTGSDGEFHHVETFARDRLGITYDQSCALFAAANTAEKVRRVAERIAGEKL